MTSDSKLGKLPGSRPELGKISGFDPELEKINGIEPGPQKISGIRPGTQKNVHNPTRKLENFLRCNLKLKKLYGLRPGNQKSFQVPTQQKSEKFPAQTWTSKNYLGSDYTWGTWKNFRVLTRNSKNFRLPGRSSEKFLCSSPELGNISGFPPGSEKQFPGSSLELGNRFLTLDKSWKSKPVIVQKWKWNPEKIFKLQFLSELWKIPGRNLEELLSAGSEPTKMFKFRVGTRIVFKPGKFMIFPTVSGLEPGT